MNILLSALLYLTQMGLILDSRRLLNADNFVSFVLFIQCKIKKFLIPFGAVHKTQLIL